MDIFKVIGIAFVGVLIVVALKEIKPDYAIFATIAVSCIIIVYLSSSFQAIITSFSAVMESTKIDTSIFNAVLKIIGIGYITEFASNICEDYGSASIAKKVQLSGKIAIFVLAMPIITNIIKVIGMLVQ